MSSGNSTTSAPKAGAGPPTGPTEHDYGNQALSNYLFIICGSIAVAVIIWKVCEKVNRVVRRVACLGHDRQRYFAIPSPNVSFLKRHVLYAPIFRKRHNREIQLSKAINVGTLPTRFQFLFLLAFFSTNIVFTVIDIPFAGSYKEAAYILRSRTGILATVNMVCRCESWFQTSDLCQQIPY